MYNAVQQQLGKISFSPRPDHTYLHNGIDFKRERDLERWQIVKSTNYPSKKETHIKRDIIYRWTVFDASTSNLVGFYRYR